MIIIKHLQITRHIDNNRLVVQAAQRMKIIREVYFFECTGKVGRRLVGTN